MKKRHKPVDSVRYEILQRMRRIIHDELRDPMDVAPSTVANRTFDHYAKTGVDVHIEYASIEHMKQMAMRLLAHTHDPIQRIADAVDEQTVDSFAELLQDRYPIQVPKGSEPQYRRREFLSGSDVAWNVARMRTAAGGLTRHSDALEAWHESRGRGNAA